MMAILAILFERRPAIPFLMLFIPLRGTSHKRFASWQSLEDAE
jgi:hypothetical protein